jgi:glycine cleavage system H lipoate-binding protein
MPVPLDRYYHRGHTWVKPEADGTLTVGLDEMGRRLIGPPDVLELPAEGSELREHAPAARIRKKGSEVQVMAPVSGRVVSVAEPGEGWWLRVRPAEGQQLSHLLRGAEVSAWYRQELERLELALGRPGAAPALADGGVLMEDLSEVCPPGQWDAVCGALFLDD